MGTFNRVCNLCEAMCGITIETENGQIKSIKGNEDDVFSHGAYCPKSQGLKDLYLDPDRLKKPLKKTPEGHHIEISWRKAFKEIAEKIAAIQTKHGYDAIATYVGNPNVHNLGSMLALPTLLRSLKTKNRYSATSVDQLPHMLVAHFMFGHSLLIPIADIDHCQYLLIFGANPVVSNGSLLSAAGLSSKLKHIQELGGKVTVVDPRYSETASQASQHLFIKPGSDVFVLAAIASQILKSKGLELPEFYKGQQDLTDLLSDYEDPHLEARTGLSPSDIEGIVKDLLSHDRAICYGRMGVSTQAHGTLCHWLINIINILTGNLDRQGGVLFTKPAVDLIRPHSDKSFSKKFARHRSRVRGLPNFEGEFPVATLIDEMTTAGPGQIKGLLTVAGNPVLSTPNSEKLRGAIRKLDLYVAIDFYKTESTSEADYILPPVSPLERAHYDIIFNKLAVRNTARFSDAVFKPDGKEDFQIILNLVKSMKYSSFREKMRYKLLTNSMLALGPIRTLNILLKRGPYQLTVKQLKKNPNGMDLGPLKPSLPKRLCTPDRKVDLAPPILMDSFKKLKEDLAKPIESRPSKFQLIGRRNLRSNNSWMHNCPSLRLKKRDFHILINDVDGQRLNVKNGDSIVVKSKTSHLEGPVRLSQNIMSGVISIPHGWGHKSSHSQLQRATKIGGENVNVLLDNQEIDPNSGNAVLNGQWVEIHPSNPIG